MQAAVLTVLAGIGASLSEPMVGRDPLQDCDPSCCAMALQGQGAE